jgi:hypothetical protein
MKKEINKRKTCAVCGKLFSPNDLIPANSIRTQMELLTKISEKENG